MRLKRLSLVVLFGALPIVGIGSSAVYAQSQEVPVVLTEWRIEPATITVQAGMPVRFNATNPGQRPHDLRIEGQGVMMEVIPGDGNIPPGQMATFEFTFTTPGTYEMWCPVGNGSHRAQGMEGTFVVAAAAGAPAAQATPKPAGQPAAQPAAKPAPQPAAQPSPKPAGQAAPAPVQAPAALPRTGDPGTTLLVGVLGVAGAALFSAGAALRRRRDQ